MNVSSNYHGNPKTTHTILILKRGTNLTEFDKKIILPKAK